MRRCWQNLRVRTIKVQFYPRKKFDLSVGLMADYCVTAADQWWIDLILGGKYYRDSIVNKMEYKVTEGAKEKVWKCVQTCFFDRWQVRSEEWKIISHFHTDSLMLCCLNNYHSANTRHVTTERRTNSIPSASRCLFNKLHWVCLLGT